MKTCTDCIYKGINLNYSQGPVIIEWISCTYPIPWYLKSKAVAYRDIFGKVITHNCEVFKKKETQSIDIDVIVEDEEIYGC